MKFLVIGGSGFVGRNLLVHLEAEGYQALGTKRTSSRSDLIAFDLAKDCIQNCVDPGFFHGDEPVVGVIAAGITQIDRCFRDRETSQVVNVDNTIRLIQDLQTLGVKPLFISSSFVFDGETGYDNEDRPIRPVNLYGRQKAEVESFIAEQRRNVLVLRLDKVVGDNPDDPHMFAEWRKCILDSKVINCIQDQLFSPIFVEDIARAIVQSCERELSGVFNLAGSEFFTREELARQFVYTLSSQAKIVSLPMKDFGFLDKRPLKSYLDSTKFVNATGISFTSMRTVMNSFIRNTQTVVTKS